MSEPELPKLEAPGAGLSAVQEFMLRYVAFPLLKRLITWEQALAIFEKEGRRILGDVRSVAPSQRRRCVLVPRLMGIEDSSRHWSLDMTLDHLLIVSQAVREGVVSLSQGKTIDFTVDTAKVKPRVETPEHIDREFEELLGNTGGYLSKHVIERHATNCHVHPWFGCLNPHQWMVMLAIHQYIHRRQVAEIKKRLLQLG